MPTERRAEQPIDVLRAFKLRVVNGLTLRETASVLDCPTTTLYENLKGLTDLLDTEQLASYEAARPHLLSAVEQRLVASLAEPAKLEKASLNNVAYAMTQVSQLRRLETGQSTQNLSVLSKLIESADAKLYPASALSKSDPLLSQNHESARQPSEEA